MVEQAESAVHILRKPLFCAADGIEIPVILRQAIQPGSQCRQYFRCFGLIQKLLLNDRNGIVEVYVFRIGARNFIRGIIETVVNCLRQLPALIFRDLGDGVLAGEAFLRDQALIFLDHIGDGQMDGIIFLGIVIPFIVQPLVSLGVSIPGAGSATVLAKAVLDEFLALLRRVGIAEMGIDRQPAFDALPQKVMVDLVLRDEHFALAQEVWLCGEVALRQVQTVQHNADTVCVITA